MGREICWTGNMSPDVRLNKPTRKGNTPMTNSQKKIAALITILVVGGAFAFILDARSRRQAAAEAEARKALAAIGVLVTMDSNQ